MRQTTLYLDPIWRVDAEKDCPRVSHVTHIDEILDALPHYMSALADFRFVDPDTYDRLSRIGAPITPEGSFFYKNDIDPMFLKRKPAFRAIMLAPSLFDDAKIPCVGAYITKVSAAPHIQATNHTVYRLNMIWRDEKWRGRVKSHGQSACVSISDDGEIRLLREYGPVFQKLPSPKRIDPKTQSRKGATIVHWDWKYPDWPRWIARDNNLRVNEFLRHLVCTLSSATRERDPILVRCIKGNLTCAFTVYKRDAPKFFADRVKVAGERRKILHYVRGHYRLTSDDEVFVRPHYRGERVFDWFGYQIKLSVPEWHHADFDWFDGGMIEDDEVEVDGLLTNAEIGERAAEYFDRQFFLSRKSYK